MGRLSGPQGGVKKYYAVAKGKDTGIFGSWDDVKPLVMGFPSAVHKSFPTWQEAAAYMQQRGHRQPQEGSVAQPRAALQPQQPPQAAAAAVTAAGVGKPPQPSVPVGGRWDGPPQPRDQVVKILAPVDPQLTYRMCFDGASKGNPGPAGAGACILQEGTSNEVAYAYQYLGCPRTNNEAEYSGLLLGLQVALDAGVKRIIAQGDSKLVVCHVQGVWQARQPHLLPLLDKAKQLLAKFQQFKAVHVLREYNARADELSNMAIEDGYRGRSTQQQQQQARPPVAHEATAQQQPDQKRRRTEEAPEVVEEPDLWAAAAEASALSVAAGVGQGTSAGSAAWAAAAGARGSASGAAAAGTGGPEPRWPAVEKVQPGFKADPSTTYSVAFDGASKGNPGRAGCGASIADLSSGQEVASAHQYVGDDRTNNEAEYRGLLLGLQVAQRLGIRRVRAQGDSQLVVQQVQGAYKVGAAHLQLLHRQVAELRSGFSHFEIVHVPRSENARADTLANTAIGTG